MLDENQRAKLRRRFIECTHEHWFEAIGREKSPRFYPEEYKHLYIWDAYEFLMGYVPGDI